MATHFSVDIEGDYRALLILLDHTRHNRIRWMKELLTELSHAASRVQAVYAPVGDTRYLHSHLGVSSIKYHPGAAGGGGRYSIAAGVRAGGSKHPFYVHEGTANLQGQTNKAMTVGGVGAQGRIYPKGGARGIADVLENRKRRAARSNHPDALRRPALAFSKKGEGVRFRSWVSGQRPQPFVYFSFLSTSVYTKGRLSRASIGEIFGVPTPKHIS